MKEKTAWSHLPNAGYIDRVLASLKAYPDEWSAAWDAARSMARGMAYDAARDEARDMAQDAAYGAAWNAAWNAAWDAVRTAARGMAYGAAWGAVAALIAYDDCAHYLDMPSDQLRVWAILSEKPAAILLLPANIAFEQIQQIYLE